MGVAPRHGRLEPVVRRQPPDRSVSQLGVEIGMAALSANVADRDSPVRLDPVDHVGVEQHVVGRDDGAKAIAGKVNPGVHLELLDVAPVVHPAAPN